MLFWLQHRWTNLWLLICALGTLTLFLYGFFPLKYHSGEFSDIDDLPNFIGGVSIDGQAVYDSGEHSVVLMVIDGLRYDFVREDYMPFSGEIIKNKTACIYVCTADAPTVTMPRIKSPERKKEKAQWRRTINFWRDIYAMMTGSVSSFLDVAMNFGAPAVTGDSVLRVAAARGRKSILYGDDTWLRLFPNLWSESDGTTSFFVTDYTEVDNNVTRHLDKVLTPDEKNKPTFDFLVLHYLGLDHIGHLEGAASDKIYPKLLEMDEVVKKILTGMQKWDRPGVLLVCGDHGMRDAGGHGGSTAAEVLVPLLVVKTGDNLCPYKLGPGPVVPQVDVAATVAWLLRAPPPAGCTGRVLPSLMPADARQHLYLLHLAAAERVRQLPDLDAEFIQTFHRAEKQFGHYLATGQESAAKLAREFYQHSLHEMGKLLTGTGTDFDVFALLLALVFLVLITYSLIIVTMFSLQYDSVKRITIVIIGEKKHSTASKIVAIIAIILVSAVVLTMTCLISEASSPVCSFTEPWYFVMAALSVVLTAIYFVVKSSADAFQDFGGYENLNGIDWLLIFGTLFHPWTFLGTSFIEEEHMTWYYFWNTVMFLVLIRTLVVLVVYTYKRNMGATEVQDKPHLQQLMNNVGIEIVPQWILLITLHRYLRTMNQTGDRWLFLPDTSDWLNEPENAIYLQLHVIIGTLATLAICLWNLRYMNNIMYIHSILTILAGCCILCYRIATGTLPYLNNSWDAVEIVELFWVILVIQGMFEIFTYLGVLQRWGMRLNNHCVQSHKFLFTKPKAKIEDYDYEPMDEPWNQDAVKLNMACSLSHLMLNNLMLIVILLVRPHNVIMVPGVYFTCVLTVLCLDHSFLSFAPQKEASMANIVGWTFSHIWIGSVFYFYQGNSNSLASVELSAGYVGLRAYAAGAVAARVGLHAYAAPAVAGAALYATLAKYATAWRQYRKAVWRTTNIFVLHRVYHVTVYCFVAFLFRDHLFVWTVFSPKLLYDFVATVFSFQAIATIANITFLTSLTATAAKIITYKTSW